jgi:hypothetical protein
MLHLLIIPRTTANALVSSEEEITDDAARARTAHLA